MGAIYRPSAVIMDRQQERSEEPELSSDFCEASLYPAPLIKGGEGYMRKTCFVFTLDQK